MKFYLVLFITFVLFCANLVQPEQSIANVSGNANQLTADTQFASLVTKRQKINEKQLQLFKLRLKTFASLLEQKLFSSDSETKIQYSSFQLKIQNVLRGPETSLSPADDLYQGIENIISEIGKDPLLAITYEESKRLQNYPASMTIRSDRGQGATYKQNESIRFKIIADQDCYVQVFFLSSSMDANETIVLKPLIFYPEPGKHSVYLSKGDSLFLGENGEFTVEPPYGKDIIIAIASKEQLPSQGIKDNYNISFPLNLEQQFVNIYGKQISDSLSINSTLVVSQPADTNQLGTNTAFLTEEEANSLRLDTEEWEKPPLIYRSMQAGPIIKVEEPILVDETNPTIEAVSPLDLKISFEQKDAPVDMESLEVLAKKGFLSMSITKRVREHVNGTVLEARKLDFPRGKFRIQIDIADMEGIKTTQEYRLEVK